MFTEGCSKTCEIADMAATEQWFDDVYELESAYRGQEFCRLRGRRLGPMNGKTETCETSQSVTLFTYQILESLRKFIDV